MLMVSVILGVLWHATLCAAQCNQLVPVTECVCPGQSVIYQCSVMDGSFTVYSGTAFQCPSGDITLRNNQFGTAESIGVCNSASGQTNITGRGLMVENNCYMSQVSISLGETMPQSTVSCAVEGTELEEVGTAEITPSTVAFSPPSDLSLVDASPQYLTFAWSPVPRNCPSLVYRVVATNCGTCPDRTSRTSITCTDFSTSLDQSGRLTCMLSIQTVICDGTNTPIAGNMTSMSYTLKVPSAPSLNITPIYDEEGELKEYNATIALSDLDPIFSYDSVDGSATSFTLNVLDGSGIECDSETTVTIVTSPGPCDMNGICRHSSRKKCFGISRTTIAVYVSNILGDGSSSITTIDNENNFVTVAFGLADNLRTVSCVFHNPPQNGQKMCEIRIRSSQRTRSGHETSEDTITIILDGLLEGNDVFSYDITASVGTHQVVVQGVHSPQPTPTADVGGAVAASFTLLLVAAAVVVLSFIGYLLYNYITERTPKRKLLYGKLEEKECSIKVETMKEDKKMEDAWKEFGKEQTPAVGHGYREVDDNEEISPSGKVVVKDKDGQFYAVTDVDVALRFMDEYRQIRPPKKRKLGYKGYSLFVEEKSSEVVLKEGSEFLYCRNDRVKNDLLQKVQPKLPYGAQETNHWFEVVQVKSATFLYQKCRTHGHDLEQPNDDIIVFFSFESAPLSMTVDTLKEHGRRVMAISNNHQLYEDSKYSLARSVLRRQSVPKTWKNVYFEQKGELRLGANSELLFYNPNLERVREPFEMYVVPNSADNSEVEISHFIKEKRELEDQEYSPEHVYKECKDGSQFQDGVEFMALDEKGNLCTGSRKVDAMNMSYKWKLVFIKVTDTNSKAAGGTRLFYCSHGSELEEEEEVIIKVSD